MRGKLGTLVAFARGVFSLYFLGIDVGALVSTHGATSLSFTSIDLQC